MRGLIVATAAVVIAVKTSEAVQKTVDYFKATREPIPLVTPKVPGIVDNPVPDPSKSPESSPDKQPVVPIPPISNTEDNDPLKYIRFGSEPETLETLKQKSQEAENNGYPHGVSVIERKPTTKDYVYNKVASRKLARSNFEIVKIGPNPQHYTVKLPKNLTQKDVNKFNRIFKNAKK